MIIYINLDGPLPSASYAEDDFPSVGPGYRPVKIMQGGKTLIEHHDPNYLERLGMLLVAAASRLRE